MTAIFEREFRALGRDSTLWWLRVVAGAGAVLALVLAATTVSAGLTRGGREVFYFLHVMIAAGLFGFGPALTADCITRERREGTLGLLLATPVGPHRVVLGKVQVNLLRLLSLWLATVPVGVLPFVAGAVGPGDVGFVLALEFAAGAIGLGAGMLASSTAREWEQALGVAYGLAAALAVVAAGVAGLAGLAAGSVSPGAAWLATGVALAGMGILLFCLLLVIAGERAWRMWRGDSDTRPPPPPDSMEAWEARNEELAAEAWRSGPGRRVRDRNPLLWLRLRNRRGGGLWGLWCLGVFIGWVLAVAAGSGRPAQVTTLLLVVLMARTAARAFREEIRTGTLELLLCLPLSGARVLRSRVRMVAREFLPATLLQLALAAWPAAVDSAPAGWHPAFHALLPLSLLAVPAYGLWASPRGPFFLLAAALTAVIAVGPVLFLGLVTAGLAAAWHTTTLGVEFGRGPSLAAMLLTQAVLGAAAWGIVAAEFRERRFAVAPVLT